MLTNVYWALAVIAHVAHVNICQQVIDIWLFRASRALLALSNLNANAHAVHMQSSFPGTQLLGSHVARGCSMLGNKGRHT